MLVLDIIGRFFRQSILSFKSLFGWLDPKIYVLVKVINPIFVIMFFSLLAKYTYGVDDVTPWVIGNSFLLCTYNAIFGVGNVLAIERVFGTLKIVIASPSNKFLVFVGRAFMHIIDAVITVLIGLIAGALIFGVSFKGVNFPLFALNIFVAMFAASGLGLMIGSFGLWIRDMNLLMNTAAMGLLALTGANFPIEMFPNIIQKVCYGLPVTRSIKAAALLMDGGSRDMVYRLMSQEIVVGIIYTTLGYVLLKIMERVAKNTASLDIY
ncbi:ABC transporter permease [Alkalicella caledoniensis]|uniref:ABC transporter permease n=1 Tax=Alkalicella caledoniensis TaxID=2731377 RepID=A0A7G9WB09_ALKCA|nr:ABC transporter permease [Alkalicella caledoniensis]QNO15871.1 ABC transporter permease [Alkalicella caledoniensis]